VRHIAHVVREDDGTGALARELGGAYRRLLAGTARDLPAAFLLPPAYRIDVDTASDQQIVDAVARLIAAYLESLAFARDTSGAFTGSPYDAFLERNQLPRAPAPGEAAADYARRLLERIDALEPPRWVRARELGFRLHDQEFAFGPRELHGLRLFLLRKPGAAGGAGNCASCHPPPEFTDFRFHNTGAAESEYDAVHGSGAFAALHIPGLDARNADPDQGLPATPGRPHARGPFRAVPERAKPGLTDLGVWNVVGHPDLPGPQAALRAALGRPGREEPVARLLQRAVACFKTPGLRDLGHSEPYLHTGRARSLEEVIAHYVEFSARARTRTMRNADPELSRIRIEGAREHAALAAFLRALNEDYE
jgi:cytochrome c peroxidase